MYVHRWLRKYLLKQSMALFGREIDFYNHPDFQDALTKCSVAMMATGGGVLACNFVDVSF